MNSLYLVIKTHALPSNCVNNLNDFDMKRVRLNLKRVVLSRLSKQSFILHSSKKFPTIQTTQKLNHRENVRQKEKKKKERRKCK